MGMIATRAIKYGELILEEMPILTARGSAFSFSDFMKFEQLSKEKKASVLSLHNAYPELEQMKGLIPTVQEHMAGLYGKVSGIMKTNVLAGASTEDNNETDDVLL